MTRTRRYAEGGAWFKYCPSCGEAVVEAHIDGLAETLSRIALPLADAEVLGKYRQVFNVWVIWMAVSQLECATWYPSYGKPVRGKLYSEHICGFKP